MRKVLLLATSFMFLTASCFKKHPVNENALLHQKACIESINTKDYQRAHIHCELCLEYESSMPECLNGIGLIALTNNDEEKAKTFFTRALRQNNDYSQARNNIGVIYFSHGDFSSALKYFSRALEIDPSNTDARYNSGLCHFRLAQKMRSLKKNALSIEYLKTAKDQINKLLALEPTYIHAFRDLGLIELNLYDLYEFEDVRKNNLTSALDAFSRCLEISVEDDGCHEGLAQVFLEQGRFDQSFSHFFMCLTYAPENSACRKGIVTAYQKSAHATIAYKEFKNKVASDNSNALAHEAFCAALFERGFNDEAVKECHLSARLKPDLCSVQYRLADYFAGVLDTKRAVQHCQAFLSCGSTYSNQQIKRCQEILATLPR